MIESGKKEETGGNILPGIHYQCRFLEANEKDRYERKKPRWIPWFSFLLVNY